MYHSIQPGRSQSGADRTPNLDLPFVKLCLNVGIVSYSHLENIPHFPLGHHCICLQVRRMLITLRSLKLPQEPGNSNRNALFLSLFFGLAIQAGLNWSHLCGKCCLPAPLGYGLGGEETPLKSSELRDFPLLVLFTEEW